MFIYIYCIFCVFYFRGIRRNNLRQLAGVAHKVGLQMPKPTEFSSTSVGDGAGGKYAKARDAVIEKHR
jgi:hypothetical protein